MAGMNAIAATVRGTTALVADNAAAPTTPAEIEALTQQFPAEEFPHVLEAVVCSPDFLNEDFEFGVRALARGLLGSVGE
jgi:hypothetical protein